ncbi:MAG: Druantia anti-phage system protein DruA [Ferrimicrobium sp.]
MRYLIYAENILLGAIGFGASAWKLSARDDFIGWTPDVQESNLHLVVTRAF